MRSFTPVEQRIDDAAHRLLARGPSSGVRGAAIEFLVFGAKQAWACIFGAALLALIVAARLWYPDDAVLARNDLLTLVAVALQVVMIATRLETGRELWVVVLFHVVGTGMELFKTDVGSWSYAADGILRIGAVPLFSGFLYASVGSYMVRIHRLFDVRFERWPRRWATAVVAVLIYSNFFSHHYLPDARWLLVAAVAALWIRSTMVYRVHRGVHRMPVPVTFALVAFFIWLAENVATSAGAWLYPDQLDGWHLVSLSKLVSWFLLMIVSVVLVTVVYPPQTPDGASLVKPAAGRARG
ncbi:DUF817 domain-containing protein [Rathayibacter iranicus]|uniref:DUF817 domain-containing protein n=2 Tax=Rathayibacter iranicus TaxID=59737 RepID=A0AAD1EMJ2_9MICO|nr:DUF817 domain-containing protein [Rathayibacter iranicus]AZZ56172.1 DUF817 domain-containing protein [Rathayibacter iranicus]MWV30129.1 DUF817 family protein [Rathayibacter iranicus NCPPB 2253 = VKM Ac-1602]PPI46240.1 DUF817 domain-containing protein [Rathayibacter iranicus]PPI59614.1 DUF817 domain-containing protein [Rathayibacter iranicus]PPI71092.1 DUF817 domain-containing protein [Rathayibacter iranicus]